MRYFYLFCFITIAISAPVIVMAKSSLDMPPGLQAIYQQSRHQIEVIDEKGKPVWRTHNDANRLNFEFDGNGVAIHPPGDEWRLRMTLIQFGSPEQLKPVKQPGITIKDNRLTYERGALQEWYINDSRGMEQGFTLHEPLGKEDLVLEGALEGNV